MMSCLCKILPGAALDYPICTTSGNTYVGLDQRLWLKYHIYAGYMERLKDSQDSVEKYGAADDVSYTTKLKQKLSYQPCEVDYTSSYLNQRSVKLALHVNPTVKWRACSSVLNYNVTDIYVDMAPYYRYLLDRFASLKLKIMVYSGDDDAVCPTVGTQSWIWDMGYDPVEPVWQPYFLGDQPSGYVTYWNNSGLSFVTVHGAGHEVSAVDGHPELCDACCRSLRRCSWPLAILLNASASLSQVPAYTPELALEVWSRYLSGNFTAA